MLRVTCSLWARNCQVCVVDANFCSFKRHYLEQDFYTHYFTKPLTTLTTARKRWLGFRSTVGPHSQESTPAHFVPTWSRKICNELQQRVLVNGQRDGLRPGLHLKMVLVLVPLKVLGLGSYVLLL